MPLGRPKRPLFDLIAEQKADARRRAALTADSETPASVEVKPTATRPAAPASTISGTATAAPRATAEVSRTTYTRSRPQGVLSNLLSGGRAKVELTTPWVAAAAAVLLGGLLLIWVVAYKMGEKEGVNRIAGAIESSTPPSISTPPASQIPVPGPTNQPGSKKNDSRSTDPKSGDRIAGNTPANAPVKPTASVPAPARGNSPQPEKTPDQSRPTSTPPNDGLPLPNPTEGGTVVAFNGSYNADPRTVGNNYLVIASNMTREDARLAVDFLGANGFRALGVPYSAVDRRSDDGKNVPLYKLVSSQGFDGSAMKETQSQRDRIADEVTRLGQIYQRQHRGKYNFAKVHWEKYVR